MEKGLESYMDNILYPNDYSEEVYFGISHPFSQEMINHVTRLREELKTLLGADWSDKNKYTIKIRKECEGKTKLTDLAKILNDMGECISRHCNIEKCYIGLFNDINAFTYPLVFDSNVLLKDTKNAITKSDGYFYLNETAIRTDRDIQSQLMKLEDIAVNKKGWKFKNKDGKVFIINIGIPLIVDRDFESTPEDVCSVIFHEIGHNFQQILRGHNQMLIDYYTRFFVAAISNRAFFNIFGYLEAALVHLYLGGLLKNVTKDNKIRFKIIKSMLECGVVIDANGNIMSRKDIGEEERAYIEKIIEEARKRKGIVKLSLLTRFLVGIPLTIIKIIKMVFVPIQTTHDFIHHSEMNRKYHDVIKEYKVYEQFADVFAVSYGFGGYSSKFYLNFEKLIKKSKDNKARFSHLALLNYVPFISHIEALNELNCRKMMINAYGYDESHVRIAQIFRTLDHELKNNKDLSPKQKKEIITHMEIVKSDYEDFIKLEMENFSSNPSVSKWLMKKLRSGDIESVANESGLVEGVLEVIDAYEKSGKIKEPPVVENFKDLSLSKKSIDKVSSVLEKSMDFFNRRLQKLGWWK